MAIGPTAFAATWLIIGSCPGGIDRGGCRIIIRRSRAFKLLQEGGDLPPGRTGVGWAPRSEGSCNRSETRRRFTPEIEAQVEREASTAAWIAVVSARLPGRSPRARRLDPCG